MIQMLSTPLTVLSGTEPLITSPTWIFFVVLCVILLAPLLGRLRIPYVVGLILAGVLVGPFGLNLLARDASFELFGQVGIYYIMFLAGLELNMASVERYGTSGLRFGLLTCCVPFLLGVAVSMKFLHLGLFTSLLLACIYSSHTLVSYPIVGRYGMSSHRTVVISVVATVFTTFVSLLVVALVVGAQQPDMSATKWLIFGLKCLTYGAFVLCVYPRLCRWFLRRFSDSVLQFIFILALVFLSAALASLAGLEGLLGAFLAGLTVNRSIPKTSPLMNRLEFVGNALFIPYFLIGVGMLVDVRILLGDLSTMWVVLVMVLTATITKWIAAWLMNFCQKGKNKWTNVWLMFGLTNAHAAGALAIVMIGTQPEVGLMNSQILNGTVMLIFFSCIISSLATEKGARELTLTDSAQEKNRGSYHGKCLITYSQEDNVDVMTQLAILIRNPYIPDSLMGLAVAYDGADGEDAERHRRGKELLDKAQKMAAAADVPMATLNRMSTNIAGGILHTMKEYECGEVIMCLTDRTTGMAKSSLGSIIDSVVGGSHREVMAVRSIVPPGTIHRVVVVVPQKAEYEVGFYKWLEHICRIGEQLDCLLEFHAHQETLPYIWGYMKQHHIRVRADYKEMNLWTKWLNLQHELDSDAMLVVITARPGFISYQSSFDNLPLQIHRYFSDTNVMLLYPDQWGDPQESLSVFTPNGAAITRQPSTLRSWLKRRFFTANRTGILLLMLLPSMLLQAEGKGEMSKMSALVRQTALQHTAEVRANTAAQKGQRKAAAQGGKSLCALVRTTAESSLHEQGCRVLANWGDIYVAEIPVGKLATLSEKEEVQRIEAGRRCMPTNDTTALITGVCDLHTGNIAPGEPYTGRGVVMGLMDIGFDLTHPTFYSSDGADYRVRAFWDQLDYSARGTAADTLFVGREYTTRKDILEKAHAADGLQQFHGTHTAGTAAGSGYNSPYVGMAPEAELCLVANAVSSDRDLIPDSMLSLYTTATDLLGFRYIFDYAEKVGKPCVISFSEGAYQDLYGDNQLAEEVLDSLTGAGRLLVASAGNQGVNPRYLYKPKDKEKASTRLVLDGDIGYVTLRSSTETTIQLTFYAQPGSPLDSVRYTSAEVLACEDSLLVDTFRQAERTYVLMLTAYPSCYDEHQQAMEMYLQDITQQETYPQQIVFRLDGDAEEVEAFAQAGNFFNSTYFPNDCDAVRSHDILFPGSSPSVICVGSTAYRTGVLNHAGKRTEWNMGENGELASFSSTGPTMLGLNKPDVMAPGTNIVSGMSSFYLQENKEDWHTEFDVKRFQFNGREYSWNAQTGTSMSTPVVAGIIATWLQAVPTLTQQEVMEAFAATCTRPDATLSYPNNQYGYGQIAAAEGLRYLLDKHTGIAEMPEYKTGVERYYDMEGRRIDASMLRSGHIYIMCEADGKIRKVRI